MEGTSLQFLDTALSLIHVPLNVYSHFLHPILSLILEPPLDAFVNVSVTPLECSIICPSELAMALFAPIIARLQDGHGASMGTQNYIAIQVDAEGMAGSRVLNLTAPLAAAGISIFFITTYFSDYILVPQKSVLRVTKALELQGFAFEKHAHAFVSSQSTPLSTPPVKEVLEGMFSVQDANPSVDLSARLVCCGARDTPLAFENSLVCLGVVKTLGARQLPKYFSVTLAPEQTPLSLLLPYTLAREDFPPDSLYIGDVWIPILLDLRAFSINASGIVCEVASRLSDGKRLPAIGMSYLSTVYGGSVMVSEKDVESAVEVLEAYNENDMHVSVLSLGSCTQPPN